MKRPRFSLSLLLFVVTVVALFFGYAQWRRMGLYADVANVKSLGVQVQIKEHWLWPTVAQTGFIALDMGEGGDVDIRNGACYVKDDAIQRVTLLEKSAQDIGVGRILYYHEADWQQNWKLKSRSGSVLIDY